MLRIEANLLNIKGERYYYQGILFTGIAFFLNEAVVEKISEYSEGQLIGPYISKWLDNSEGIQRIDLNELDGDGEHQRAFFKGQPFTGIGYDIDDGVCHQESDYKNGRINQVISFFGDGYIDFISLVDGDISEYMIFNKKGFLVEHRMMKNDVFDVFFKYSDKDLLSLSIDGEFFNVIKSQDHLIDMPDLFFIDTLDDVKKIEISSKLKFFGMGVCDDLAEAILVNPSLRKVEKIILFDTSLSLSSIVDLINATELSSIWIDDDRKGINFGLSSILTDLKLKRPTCEIELNSKPILSL